MAFNLESLALKETAAMTVRHPATGEALADDKGNAVTIDICGTSSKQYRDAITRMQQRALRRGKKNPTVAELREEGVELLVQCSDRINNLTYKNEPVDTAEAFRAIYGDPKFAWLKDQVDEFLGSTSDFLTQ